MDSIRAALNSARWADAESQLIASLAEQPSNAELLALQADLNVLQGRLTAGLDSILKAQRADPANSHYRLREAQFLSWLGRLQTADERYQALLKAFPQDQDIRTGRALVLYWRGDWRGSLGLFDEVLQAQPENVFAFISRARVIAASGHPTEAWRLLSERDRQSGGADPEIGLLLASLANRVGACQLTESLASRPASDPDIVRQQLALKASQLIAQGEHARGLELLRAFALSHPRDYNARVDLANALATADQRAAARSWYDRAREITPERPEARLGLARLASREGRLLGSLALYRQILHDNPESLEAWLGVARTATLMDSPADARRALDQAERIAPRSSLVLLERLRQALQAASIPQFEVALRQFRDEQPHDVQSLLWEQRWLHATGQNVDLSQVVKDLDPLDPAAAAHVIRILNARSDPAALTLASSPAPPDLDASLWQASRLALARQLALLLQRDLALRVAHSAGEEFVTPISILANGWWAYAATPWASRRQLESLRTELGHSFDPQALAVWTAGEVQKRLRLMEVEAESPLFEDWLLQRARWFARWESQWADPSEPATALDSALRVLTPQWHEATPTQVAEAWRLSEASPANAEEPFAISLQRARWRQYRFDYDGALQLLSRLRADYPLANEPAQRMAAVLRSSGRWQEAERSYQYLAAAPDASPLVRLEYADILRLLGRHAASAQQYSILAGNGFDEPQLYLGHATLAASRGLTEQAWEWSERGRTVHPDDSGLQEWQARSLWQRDEPERLAQLLATGPVPAWIDPDLLAKASHVLPTARRQAILRSPSWWLSWRWLPWERLAEHSLGQIHRVAESAISSGQSPAALSTYQGALSTQLPDTDLWFAAGRVLGFNGRNEEAERAFRVATLLGTGRLDGETAVLLEAIRNSSPERARAVAREFNRRLMDRPHERALLSGLVAALLQAGEVTSANRALTPLVESSPDDPETRLLTAQVRASSGRIRQARSLYANLLRRDPWTPDARAGIQALRDADQFGASVGHEQSTLRDNSVTGQDRPDWRETTVSLFWRRPAKTLLSADYHEIERFAARARQLNLHGTFGWTGDWLLRLDGGLGWGRSFIPDFRTGAGVSHRLHDRLFLHLDTSLISFPLVRVWQTIPGVTWQWHPRFTSDLRLFISHNRFDAGGSDLSLTTLIGTLWQWDTQSWLKVHYAFGDEATDSLIPDLIGRDRIQAAGLMLHLGWKHRWALEPAYRFERHRTFDIHTVGATLQYSF